MGQIIPENAVPPRAQQVGTNGRASLFPNEPIAVKPPEPKPHQSLADWVLQRIPDLAPLGSRIFSAERREKKRRDPLNRAYTEEWVEGDPLEDGRALWKALKGENNRKFAADWLFHFADEYGRDMTFELLGFLCSIWGARPPEAISDEDAELVEIRRELAERRDRDAMLEARLAKIVARRGAK